MHEFVKPVQRGELRDNHVGVREATDWNEESTGGTAEHNDKRKNLRSDVLRGKKIPDEQSECGEEK